MALLGGILLAMFILWSVAHAFEEELDVVEKKLQAISIGLIVLVVVVSLVIKFRGG